MKEIPGYESLYAADEEGNIYSLNYKQSGVVKKMKTYYW